MFSKWKEISDNAPESLGLGIILGWFHLCFKNLILSSLRKCTNGGRGGGYEETAFSCIL